MSESLSEIFLEESSIDDTPVTKSSEKGKTVTFIFYCLAFFSLGLVLASLGPAFPFLTNATNTTVGELSGVFTSRAIGYLIGSVVSGPLYDKFNGNVITGIALFFTGVSVFFVPFVESGILLGFITSFQGLAMGSLDTGGNVMLIYLLFILDLELVLLWRLL
eukprot:TRINITY_DN3042_c0_g1_i1.p1 TRINITY_DN3042_c0_g1~~TRINITY_DN3042_c0_g1_i1.p1  ORF type:complete len:162 (+),score=25.60 TRINITY_DN3042_c0_g1_i1:99-584(+)